MGMSIDEIIANEQEIFKMYQKTVDTHIVSEDLTLEELYGDDTEIIEKELKWYQKHADFHNQIINIMRKYQKIQEIYQKWNEVNDFAYNQAMLQIGKVLESEEIPND